MLAQRRAARDADVVHFQWLAVQPLDGPLLPARRPARADRPRRAAARAAPRPAPRTARLYAPRRRGRRPLRARRGGGSSTSCGIDPARVHVIPHGGVRRPARRRGASCRPSWPRSTTGGRSCCSSACCARTRASTCCSRRGDGNPRRASCGSSACRGWTSAPCEPPRRPTCASSRASSPTPRRPVCLRRADVVVLPYREIDQSGVLVHGAGVRQAAAAQRRRRLRRGRRGGCGRLVAAGDAGALRDALAALLADPAARAELAQAATALADGAWSWDASARAHIGLYERLAGR